MGFPATTNVNGSNPGPNSAVKPDVVQMPVGNRLSNWTFSLAVAPVAVAANTTAEQAFAATGIGLIVGDFVDVIKPTAQAGLGIVNARVSAIDTLAITYINATAGSLTPTAESYQVSVARTLPNWSPPASGNQLDF